VPRSESLVCAYQQEDVWVEQRPDPPWAAYHIIPYVLRLSATAQVGLGRARWRLNVETLPHRGGELPHVWLAQHRVVVPGHGQVFQPR
jgi:hypothetical protein